MKIKKPKVWKKEYGSLLEFALFGKDDEEIDVATLIATKKKQDKITTGGER